MKAWCAPWAALVLCACRGGDAPAGGPQAHAADTGVACVSSSCLIRDSDPIQAGFVSPLDKVYREEPYDLHAAPTDHATLMLARNEYESTQLVLFATQALPQVMVEVSALRREHGGGEIPAADIEVNPVGYITLGTPRVESSRTGMLPDPLLPNGPLALDPATPQAVLITLHSRSDTPAGRYHGTVTVRAGTAVQKRLELRAQVWNFTLPARSRFKSAALTGWNRIDKAWPRPPGGGAWSDDDRLQRFLRLADLGFRNRLPPVGFLANGLSSWNSGGTGGTDYGFPTHDVLPDGSKRFNAERTDRLIDYLLEKGANHFFIGFTSDLFADPALAAQRSAALLRYLGDYTAHLRSRGLLDRAYLYGIDEPWGEAVEHAKQTWQLVKGQFPDLRVLQNTNQNNDAILGQLLGFLDAVDINLGFYDITGAADYRRHYPQQLGDFWWNLNIWPATHPNLFVEFPFTDARIVGPLSYKYKIDGFEYWDLLALTGITGYKPLAPHDVLTGWTVNGSSLDGTLVYPAADGSFYSSMRFENFRDGMEDQEYLYLLEQIDPINPLLQVPIVTSLTTYDTDPGAIQDFRQQIGERLDRAGLP